MVVHIQSHRKAVPWVRYYRGKRMVEAKLAMPMEPNAAQKLALERFDEDTKVERAWVAFEGEKEAIVSWTRFIEGGN